MGFFNYIRDQFVLQPIVDRADKYLGAERFENALRTLEDGFDLSPHYPPFLWIAARAEFSLGNFEAVNDYLNQMEERMEREQCPARFLYRGIARYRIGLYRAAQRDLTEAILLGINLPKAYSYRAKVYMHYGQYTLALEDLQAVDSLSGPQAEVLRKLADVSHKLKRHEWTLNYLEQLSLIEELKVGEWTQKGYALSGLHNSREAIYAFTKVLDQKPFEKEVLVARGIEYLNLGYEEKALQDFDAAIQIQPTDSIAHAYRSQIWLHKKELEKAGRDLDIALALDPDSPVGHRNYASFKLEQADIPAAEDALQTAFRLNPGLPLLHYLQGKIFFQQGQKSLAFEAWNRSAGMGEERGLASLRQHFG